MQKSISRRAFISGSTKAIISLPFINIAGPAFGKESNRKPLKNNSPFRISLNTSTISGYNLLLEKQISLCSNAGYDGIELWIKDVRSYLQNGGKIDILKAKLENSRLQLENMIGFAPWLTGDDGMKEMKEDINLSSELGSKCIAATGYGVQNFDYSLISSYSEKYDELLEYCAPLHISPLIELWGHRAFNKLSKVMAIALESGQKEASLLLDFYHLYRGNNSFNSLEMLNGKILPVFHINDYPANIPVNDLKDSDRIFPGDGVCPFNKVLPLLYHVGFRGALSLELFNSSYWKRYTPEELLAIGYEKINNVIHNNIDYNG